VVGLPKRVGGGGGGEGGYKGKKAGGNGGDTRKLGEKLKKKSSNGIERKTVDRERKETWRSTTRKRKKSWESLQEASRKRENWKGEKKTKMRGRATQERGGGLRREKSSWKTGISEKDKKKGTGKGQKGALKEKEREKRKGGWIYAKKPPPRKVHKKPQGYGGGRAELSTDGSRSRRKGRLGTPGENVKSKVKPRAELVGGVSKRSLEGGWSPIGKKKAQGLRPQRRGSAWKSKTLVKGTRRYKSKQKRLKSSPSKKPGEYSERKS